jgi:hypothetical protein
VKDKALAFGKCFGKLSGLAAAKSGAGKGKRTA